MPTAFSRRPINFKIIQNFRVKLDDVGKVLSVSQFLALSLVREVSRDVVAVCLDQHPLRIFRSRDDPFLVPRL